MKLDTIGKNIRKFRLARKLRQEDLAEKTDLTTNYIGMVERGEKIPSLETFIKIVNACGGKAWIIVTSQQDIDSITKTKGNDFSKIQGRFDTRLSLSSANVDEVIKKRMVIVFLVCES